MDASLETRSHKTLQVREKFDDVFQVSDECEIGVESDFENYSDDVSVADCLSNPNAVEFSIFSVDLDFPTDFEQAEVWPPSRSHFRGPPFK
jgi:hypothetical protein